VETIRNGRRILPLDGGPARAGPPMGDTSCPRAVNSFHLLVAGGNDGSDGVRGSADVDQRRSPLQRAVAAAAAGVCALAVLGREGAVHLALYAVEDAADLPVALDPKLRDALVLFELDDGRVELGSHPADGRDELPLGNSFVGVHHHPAGIALVVNVDIH